MASSPSPSTETAIESPAFELRSIARLPEPLTSFIGRENELHQLQTLFNRPSTRLVTLTGPGGVGKTRLAITFARERSVSTNSPVAFIPLAPIRDSSLVAPTIGAAFGLSDSGNQSLAERLQTILQDKPFLLVLDNFEHLVDSAPLTSLLLNTCPTLKVLATSRRSLHVSGEIEYLVPPLDTPDAESSLEAIEKSTSYQLFAERSAAVAIGVVKSIHRSDTEAIGAICLRLDGLPLAIELAAARTRVLSPSELLKRLDLQLPLLTGGPLDAPVRLQTMRDAIAWSYDLLSDEEQWLLRTLSVFSGGFTLEAVEAVATSGLETPPLELFTRLIDHSLVRRMQAADGPSRFTMLETIREFALDALIAFDEETGARERHLQWLVEQLGSPESEDWDQLRGRIQIVLPEEHDNLRTAMAWALQREDPQRAAQVAWGLLPFWWQRELLSEGQESLQRIVDQGKKLDPILRAGMLSRISEFAFGSGNYGLGYSTGKEVVDICRDINYPAGIRAGLHNMGACSDPSEAVELMNQAAEISRSFPDSHRYAMDIGMRAQALTRLGEPQQALEDASEALAILRVLPGPEESLKHDYVLILLTAAWTEGMLGLFDRAYEDANQGLSLSSQLKIPTLMSWAHRMIGEVERARGNYHLAFEHFRAALHSTRRQGALGMERLTLIQFGMLAQAAGKWGIAARLFGFTERTGYSKFYATWHYDVHPTRLALGETEYTLEFTAGQQFSRAEAFESALSLSVADQVPATRSSILTRRETEVLVHLAQGKTNQEIADDLFLGKSTVDTHVAHILAKLGVETRWKAVNLARERGLL